MSTRDSGKQGETMACAYLLRQGYTLLAKNFRMQRYEIDLVMAQGETIVFVEVKARSAAANAYISGREAVTRTKQAHIIRAAQGYLRLHNAFARPVRFDVVEVNLTTGHITHIPAAFRA